MKKIVAANIIILSLKNGEWFLVER